MSCSAGVRPCDSQLITLRQLSYRVSGKMVLRNLDLFVEQGETFAVMGMSGVGKSTLLKCIGGLIQPTSGHVIVDGVDIAGLSESHLRQVRRKIGMVFQYAALFDSLNVYENVAFGLRRHMRMNEADMRAAVAERLALVGLSGTEPLMPSQLSGGMQKRVGLARALALDPPILLYDEPTSGLDPITAATIAELIVRTRDQLGVTSVVVSHDVALIKRVANRIGMLHRGKIVQAGTRQEMEESDNPVVRQFMEGSTEGPIKL
ncbi:MAG: ABC transporter ATP-binding protein [Armatimonadetes bacterium]|nr:ABC transporter ATP-binding protein [Armatimonadota bacterium]